MAVHVLAMPTKLWMLTGWVHRRVSLYLRRVAHGSLSGSLGTQLNSCQSCTCQFFDLRDNHVHVSDAVAELFVKVWVAVALYSLNKTAQPMSLESRLSLEPLEVNLPKIHQAVLDNQQVSGCEMDA